MKNGAKLIGYTGVECPHCGRLRVELWQIENELEEICEKCNWNLTRNEYEQDDV